MSHALPASGSLLRTQQPGEVTSYTGVRATPQLLALLLGLLGVGVLAHVLISSTRARRRDFAVLKTIGLVRRQVASSVMWEATALTGASIAVGMFFGLLAGQVLWRRFTGDLGVRASAVVPFSALAIAAAVLLLVANLIALVPAYRASRLPASSALRDE